MDLPDQYSDVILRADTAVGEGRKRRGGGGVELDY